MLIKFDSWSDVLTHVDTGGWLWYHAPLDLRASSVLVRKRYKNGKLRLSSGDVSFTADSGHLDRMRRQ